MEIITLLPLKRRLISHYRKIPTASISTQYRHLRNDSKYALFGDFPLLAFVIKCAVDAGIPIKKSQVQRALRTSDELVGNRQILAYLIGLNSERLRTPK